jgi:hypothetical protein
MPEVTDQRHVHPSETSGKVLTTNLWHMYEVADKIPYHFEGNITIECHHNLTI